MPTPRRIIGIAAWTLAVLLIAHHHRDIARDVAGAVMLGVATLAIPLLWPVLRPPSRPEALAPLVALVGCDGSGKSTLSGDMVGHFSPHVPVQVCYLGLGSGAMGERIKRWPVIGAALEARLARRGTQVRTRGERIPGLLTALVVYFFSLARLRRFRRMLALRRAGVAVITDRYPQTEVAGFYDGPGLSAARPGGWIVAALARQERRLYDWMVAYAPDVVIRLNVDADTAWARKPDHRYDLLSQKVEATGRLRFNGAHIVDVDSAQPYDTVRSLVTKVVDDTFRRPATPAMRARAAG